MENKNNFDKKYFQNNAKKKQMVMKSINNYLFQLKIHFEMSDEEIYGILKSIKLDYKKTISSKRWWQIFN